MDSGKCDLVDVLSSSDWSKHIALLHLNEKHSDVVLKIIGREQIPATSGAIGDIVDCPIKHIPVHSSTHLSHSSPAVGRRRRFGLHVGAGRWYLMHGHLKIDEVDAHSADNQCIEVGSV